MNEQCEELAFHVERLKDATTPGDARVESDLWLQMFRRSGRVWDVGVSVLEATPLDKYLAQFAAQCLRFRMNTGFHELAEAGGEGALREALVGLVVAAGRDAPGGPVETQVVLALVGLALQMGPQGWPGAVEDMVGVFTEQVDDAAVGIRALLLFLRFFPEEVENDAIALDPRLRGEAYDAFLDYDTAKSVLSLLASLLTSAEEAGNEDAYGLVLLAVGSWVPYIEGPDLADSGLLDAMLGALRAPPGTVLDGAVGVLMAVLEASHILLPVELEESWARSDPDEYQDLLDAQDGYVDVVSVLFPGLVELLTQFDPSSPSAESQLTVIIEAGNRYQAYIQAMADEDSVAYARAMVGLLSVDSEIVAHHTLHFWWRFLEMLGEGVDLESIAIDGEMGEVYQELLGTLTGYTLLRMALHVASPELEPEEASYGHGADIVSAGKFVLGAIAGLLSGNQVLEWIFGFWSDQLHKAGADQEASSANSNGLPREGAWDLLYTDAAGEDGVGSRITRSVLHGLMAISLKVFPSQESNLPLLFLSLDSPAFADDPRVAQAMLQTIAAYAKWIGAHDDVVGLVLEYELGALRADIPALSDAAASALSALCLRIPRRMQDSFDTLIEIYRVLIGTPVEETGSVVSLSRPAALNVVFSLAVVALSMDANDTLSALEVLVTPLISGLSSLLQSVEQGGGSHRAGECLYSAGQVATLLARLAIGIQRSHSSHQKYLENQLMLPVSAILERVSPVLIPGLQDGDLISAGGSGGVEFLTEGLRLLQVLIRGDPVGGFEACAAVTQAMVGRLAGGGEAPEVVMGFLNVVIDVYCEVINPGSASAMFMAELLQIGEEELPSEFRDPVLEMIEWTLMEVSSHVLSAVKGGEDGEAVVAYGHTVVTYMDMMMCILVSAPGFTDTESGHELLASLFDFALNIMVLDWSEVACQGTAFIETVLQYALQTELGEDFPEDLPSEAWVTEVLTPLAESRGSALVGAVLDVLFHTSVGYGRVEDVVDQLYFSARPQFQTWLYERLAGLDDALYRNEEKSALMAALFDQPQPIRPLEDLFGEVGALVKARANVRP